MTENTAKQAILSVAAELSLTMTAEFVPFSRSRNKAEKSPSLNWRVTIKRMAMIDGAYKPGSARQVLTTDYSAGCAHAPSYKFSNRSHIGAAVVAWECERGKKGRWFDGAAMVIAAHPKAIMPDFADVLYSLAMDYDVLDCGDYEQWAREFGYDPDSRKGEATYRACIEIALKLRNGVGEDGMRRLREACQDY